ncbi:MAG: LytTR family transcriptional regulator [Clostridia bacterium]|nr:LytTR family transcriptional regulator [Clostridia bacterium]
MGFKVRIEIDPSGTDEVVIRCREINDEVIRMQSALSSAESSEIELTLGENVYFVSIDDILFFETDGSRTAAHTKDRMYYTDLKLYELSELMPGSFMRISKSSIVNTRSVSSIRRDITGVCEAFFNGTVKKVFVSRSYYKAFREKINETRLK